MTTAELRAILDAVAQHAADGTLRSATISVTPLPEGAFDVTYGIGIADGASTAMLIIQTQSQLESMYPPLVSNGE